MNGKELFEWAEEAEEGDEVEIGIEDGIWFEGTVSEIEETDDEKYIYFEPEGYDRYLVLTDQDLVVHIDIGGEEP